MIRKHCKFISAIKLTKHTLNEHLFSEEFGNFNKKLQVQNALFCIVLFYQLASKFNLSGINITVFRNIECWFSMIVETESFLELDFNTLSKILASSNLKTDSEVEVYNSANKWLNHNSEERSKYAKQLLLKVRLNLLSKQALEYLLSESSCISQNNDCVELLKNKGFFYQNESSTHNKSRQCNHNMFKVLICGGFDTEKAKSTNQVKEFDRINFLDFNNLPPMLENKKRCIAVYLKGEVYVFGGINNEGIMKSVEKYSPLSKKWVKVTDIPDKRQHFCACAFMDNIYIFGGYESGLAYLNSCLHFEAKLIKWKEVAKMNYTRSDAACAIYEENIVVTGGENNINLVSNTVESYDVYGKTWTPMPNMIERRCGHSLVCFKRKLYAIGGVSLYTNCEVYDKTSNKFVTLEAPRFLSYEVKSNLIGSKIFVFQNGRRAVLCYDADKEQWSKDSFEATKNICYYSTVRVPL